VLLKLANLGKSGCLAIRCQPAAS